MYYLDFKILGFRALGFKVCYLGRGWNGREPQLEPRPPRPVSDDANAN